MLAIVSDRLLAIEEMLEELSSTGFLDEIRNESRILLVLRINSWVEERSRDISSRYGVGIDLIDVASSDLEEKLENILGGYDSILNLCCGRLAFLLEEIVERLGIRSERIISEKPHLVGELMTSPPVKVHPTTTVLYCAGLMVRRNVGSVIVTRDDNPVGIITRSDIVGRCVAAGRNPVTTKAGDIMSSPVLTVNPEDTLEQAYEKMIESDIKRLVVTDDRGSILGVISIKDILRIHPFGPELRELVGLRRFCEIKSLREITQES